jgi:carbamoyltransferase
MPESILGISAYYHDSAAALLVNGEIVAAAQEERFTRKKFDASFPVNATKYVLMEAGVEAKDLTAVAFYDKPLLKFERLLETYHGFAPKGLKSFLSAIPVWVKEKMFLRKLITDEMTKILQQKPKKILFPEHHLSHAASAFYPSPFEEAAILTLDGVGEWATTTIGHGKGNSISIMRQLDFPHSIGLLYSAFTYYCGFKVNSGEYKLMGLAPYGDPKADQTKMFKKLIRDELVDIREDGSILLNMKYFDFATGLRMCAEEEWRKLFGIGKREQESYLTREHMNMALAIQEITEEIVFRLADTAHKITGSQYLTMAGGVALNCVVNGKLLKRGPFSDIWIQPAAGDSGGALGAALVGWHIWNGKERKVIPGKDSMKGAYLGPEFSSGDVKRMALKYDANYVEYSDREKLFEDVAELIANGYVIGWFQGRMEYGPRALGNRSILGDPRLSEMQKKMNLKIKHREGFRPFAPSVLEENIEEYFDLDRPSPYMLLIAPVQEKRRHPLPDKFEEKGFVERLYFLRSDIPAITHLDYSARLQSVNKNTNESYWKLINLFKKKTGYGLVVNTSFNERGEPIVCTPEDAYLCFMKTEIDYLVTENILFDKRTQKQLEADSLKKTYELD